MRNSRTETKCIRLKYNFVQNVDKSEKAIAMIAHNSQLANICTKKTVRVVVVRVLLLFLLCCCTNKSQQNLLLAPAVCLFVARVCL